MAKCKQCGIEFGAKRESARFCSPKCRVTASRKSSIVTDFVTLSDPDVTLRFQFTVPQIPEKVREALYWFDVPIGAIPILQARWPEMPDYMNGRQYFLWWKNEFVYDEQERPIIHNPFPVYDGVTYYAAAEGSKKWGI